MPTSSKPNPSAEPECLAPGEVAEPAVRKQLKKVLASKTFARSQRMSRFLRFVVEEKLAGRGKKVREQSIAHSVFDKSADFDPRLDPIVRVEARRLRSRLNDYYQTDGKRDPVLIDMNLRGYVPQFRLQDAAPQEVAATEPRPAAAPAETNQVLRAVAVLPFVDLSAEQDQQHFCDGLTDELINALTRIEGLEVVARSSSFQFKGPAHDVRKVGESLSVGTVLEGSVRRAGDRVRITAQLANANSGFHLMSETYDATVDDVFAIQEKIAGEIADTMRSVRAESLSSDLKRRQTGNPEAFSAYLEGLYHAVQAGPGELAQAVESFDKAIELDPAYAEAYGGLAHTHAKLALLEILPPAESWPEAKQKALQALELDDQTVSARASLGCAYCAGDWNFGQGDLELAKAIETDPSDHRAYEWRAVVSLAPRGRHEEALDSMLQAVKLSSSSLYSQNHLGVVRFYAGDYEKALETHEKLLRGNPEFLPALWDHARTAIQLDRLAEASASIRRARELSGGRPSVLALEGHLLAVSGKGKQARETIAALESLAENEYVSPLARARIFLALGETKPAYGELESAVEDRSARLLELDVDPIYDAIRDDDRFRALRVAVCLEQPEG